jgi:hypothetical protein
MDIQESPPDHSVGGLISQKAIDELKAIYRRKYGANLSDREAREMGDRLLRVFAVLTRVDAQPGPSSNRVHSPPLTNSGS